MHAVAQPALDVARRFGADRRVRLGAAADPRRDARCRRVAVGRRVHAGAWRGAANPRLSGQDRYAGAYARHHRRLRAARRAGRDGRFRSARMGAVRADLGHGGMAVAARAGVGGSASARADHRTATGRHLAAADTCDAGAGARRHRRYLRRACGVARMARRCAARRCGAGRGDRDRHRGAAAAALDARRPGRSVALVARRRCRGSGGGAGLDVRDTARRCAVRAARDDGGGAARRGPHRRRARRAGCAGYRRGCGRDPAARGLGGRRARRAQCLGAGSGVGRCAGARADFGPASRTWRRALDRRLAGGAALARSRRWPPRHSHGADALPRRHARHNRLRSCWLMSRWRRSCHRPSCPSSPRPCVWASH